MKLKLILEADLSALRPASTCIMLIYSPILHLRCVQFKIIVVTTTMVTDKTSLSFYCTNIFLKSSMNLASFSCIR